MTKPISDKAEVAVSGSAAFPVTFFQTGADYERARESGQLTGNHRVYIDIDPSEL